MIDDFTAATRALTFILGLCGADTETDYYREGVKQWDYLECYDENGQKYLAEAIISVCPGCEHCRGRWPHEIYTEGPRDAAALRRWYPHGT